MVDRKQTIYDIERCTCHVPGACRDCSKYKEGHPPLSCMEDLLNDALELLKEQPEIVKCKDCAFRDPRDGMCEHVLQMRDPDWYCADGERRDDNG